MKYIRPFWTSKDNESQGNDSSIEANGKKVLTLQKGLNKIVVSGGSSAQDAANAPYIGNLTFTLNNSSANASQDSSST
ncbi:VlhA.5.10 variable lipoprotein family protein C-terminal domain protein [Mycoplasmoides gallisepticum str. R(low)]|uniref:VlhA.5.10 variable lipoprotein family protein C-terminal domain protein n=1 Tax=Mycoplasmoides gallisepticum (strain R(low / passage 15 / clone 2)) TaxID=710127 RepID=D3DEJ4_MYCGA|nr:VlhA.5.10 variable lipoprotein family protein C-terminal domain protein [Mycoplasmoides gallisepticum str. R(low)]ADC30546.1 VlhA.5.10 variable lipoprotein family protein C-terminal domain protein [Mycoplasmoides gallisepticum str. R(high)]